MSPVVVNTGKAHIAGMIKKSVTAEPNFVAMGTGTTNPDGTLTVTTLDTEVETRATGTSTVVTTTTTNDTYRVVGQITAGASRAVTESGLFSASSAGTMVTRALFSAINLASGDSISFTWEIRLT